MEAVSRSSRAIDCTAAGIDTVAFDFYDGSGTYLIGDDWDCSLHEGTVNGIPAGSDRRLVVTGKNSSGTVQYRGEETGISIAAGQTTQGGEIQMEPITAPSSPTNVAATASDQEATISWDAVSGATSYHIYWATYTGVSKTDYEGVISNATSPYTHTGLTNGTTYYYVITAENSYGESDESSEVTATPNIAYRWTMLNLPDTGQTQSYTTTFGEDSDYTINPPSYTDNGDGTVTDNVTTLMWQQENDDTGRTWDEACTYCDNLTLAGYSDWRLPSAMELMSIVDYGNYDPSIDETYFPGTNASDYWSATTYASNSSYAWLVYFSYGSVFSYFKSGDYYVRCVRAGQ
ncbi:MAG: DUF1566 domain-containing protein [Deltaproteobacteria bacterium]|nr:DUF1566 domain-containing protein [Deltaproteobacteria bacterium]